jgi:hypothetical protein
MSAGRGLTVKILRKLGEGRPSGRGRLARRVLPKRAGACDLGGEDSGVLAANPRGFARRFRTPVWRRLRGHPAGPALMVAFPVGNADETARPKLMDTRNGDRENRRQGWSAP